MPTAEYRHFGCRIMEDLIYKGFRTVILENEILRIGILLDKGADIFQFLHKPSDTDYLWRSPQGLFRRDQFTATRASTSGSFLDSYHGGWQEILPGGGPADFRGAELGLHGEVAQLGWEMDILQDTSSRVSIKLSVNCIRTPLRLERIMTLESGSPVLHFEETLSNRSPEAIEFMWGHHPAFGAPFLKEGLRLFVPAATVNIHQPQFAESGIFEPGSQFAWPKINDQNGKAIDFSSLPSKEAGFADLVYLKDLQNGWYALIDVNSKIGFGLSWPKDVFPYIWFWMVFGKAPGYPWWDQVYVIALEPWTSMPNSLSQAHYQNTLFKLKGGESRTVSLCATAIEGKDTITNIDQYGNVS